MYYDSQLIWTLGSFCKIKDPDSQDATLLNIFTKILNQKVSVKLSNNEKESTFKETVMTLFRLYHKNRWEPAKTFFYIFTGQILTSCTKEVYLDLTYYDLEGKITLNERTINGLCDAECKLLNYLWFDGQSQYGEDDNESSVDTCEETEYSENSETV